MHECSKCQIANLSHGYNSACVCSTNASDVCTVGPNPSAFLEMSPGSILCLTFYSFATS